MAFISSRKIRNEVGVEIKNFQGLHPRFQPRLAIVQAGSRPDSSTYVRMKIKAAEEVGIKINHIQLSGDADVDEIVSVVNQLNADASVSGILVQLPLGPHVGAAGERIVTEAVSPEKDVDGFVNSMCLVPSELTEMNVQFQHIQYRSSVISCIGSLSRALYSRRCNQAFGRSQSYNCWSSRRRHWSQRYRWKPSLRAPSKQRRHSYSMS